MRSEFSRRLLGAMLRRRAQVEHGDALAHTSPMWPSWEHNLHRELHEQVRDLVGKGLRLHDYICALNSSQAFAMELLLPFRVGSTQGLEAFLSERLGRSVEVLEVELEFIGHGDALAETHGRLPEPDEPITAADAALHLRDAEGRRGLLLVEVKLSEDGYTRCPGPESRANRDRSACESQAFLDEPHRCYLKRPWRASRDRRYRAIFETEHGTLRAAFPGAPPQGRCSFYGDPQQLMRNHALALAWCQEGRAEWWALALVHHDDNPDVLDGWIDYMTITNDLGNFHRWPASDLLHAVDHALPGQAQRLRDTRLL